MSDGEAAAGPAGGSSPSERWLTGGVGGVAAASFFSDSGHEIATALLPSLLSSTLHAAPGTLGVIEGVSDALTGVTKLLGGPLADEPRRRATLAGGGYLATAIATGAIGLATAVWQVGVLRGFAWAARGIRSPARDALLASAAPARAYGRAFGLERAGDNLGAVAGPLLAALLVGVIGIRHTVELAVLPGAMATLAIGVAARAARRAVVAAPSPRPIRYHLGELRRAGALAPLAPVAMFEIGNVATTLLILRATDLLRPGRSLAAATSLAIVLYAMHNAVAAVAALLGGHGIDRVGPRVVFAAGALAYIGAYGAFCAHLMAWPLLAVAFILAGCGIGLVETAESAAVARALPAQLRGSGFGLLGVVQAGGDLASSAVVGLLWSLVSPAFGFGYAACWMAGAVLVATFTRALVGQDGTSPV